MLEPAVESRPWDEQLAHDDAAYSHQLVYLLEMATVATGWLAGVDPFGQPAIEEAKEFTFGLMGRPGFEARRAEIEGWVAGKDPRFIL